MDIALSAIAGAVLLWAAAAKLVRMDDAAAALSHHGVPTRLRRPAIVVLATIEAALALLLVAGVAPRSVGTGVFVMGVLFAVVLGVSWARGSTRLSCACFGRSRERHAALLVGRALALAALGAAVAIGVPDPSERVLVVGALAVLAVAVLGLFALVLALYRQVGVLAQRLAPSSALEIAEEGPAVGSAAPELGGLRREGPELVAFGSPDCRLCRELAPSLRAIERSGLAVRAVDERDEAAAFDLWGVPGTPFVALLVDGMVRAKGLVNTMEQIESVVDVGLERSRHAVS